MNYTRLIRLYLWLYRRFERVPGYWTERNMKKVTQRIKMLDKFNRTRRIGEIIYELL